MSMYAEYKAEREGKHVLETDYGFASYCFNHDTCYIEDIYVKKNVRGKKLCFEMADAIANQAQSRGCKYLMGSVCPSANGAQASLHVLLSYGMRLHSARENIVYFVKDI